MKKTRFKALERLIRNGDKAKAEKMNKIISKLMSSTIESIGFKLERRAEIANLAVQEIHNEDIDWLVFNEFDIYNHIEEHQKVLQDQLDAFKSLVASTINAIKKGVPDQEVITMLQNSEYITNHRNL